jgi:hypothetical protein
LLQRPFFRHSSNPNLIAIIPTIATNVETKTDGNIENGTKIIPKRIALVKKPDGKTEDVKKGI